MHRFRPRLPSSHTVDIVKNTRARVKADDVNLQRYGGNAVNKTRSASERPD
jgi:hypothetical protein